MNTRLIISLLCAGALAYACGPRSHSDATAALATARPMSMKAVNVSDGQVAVDRKHKSANAKSAAKAIAKINTKLNVSVSQNDVKLALDVHNVGEKFAELTFATGQAYDFIVVDSVGREVWRWSQRRMFTQGVQNKQLGAGETLQVSETWKNGVHPGKYTAIAMLKSTNFPVEQRVDFVLQ
jgi:hypothetical protein